MQLTTGGVDSILHLALCGNHIGVPRLSRKTHGRGQIVRPKDIAVKSFDLKNRVKVLKCQGTLELVYKPIVVLINWKLFSIID